MATQSNALQTHTDGEITAFEKAIVFGDIGGLDEAGRLSYLQRICKEMGLNPITRPFGYLPVGNGGLTLYLTATGGAQLRLIHAVSVTKIEDHGVVDGFYRVTVYGRMPNGREDVEFGSVRATDRNGRALAGVDLENVRKKCLTQGKTRLSKSMTGLAGVLSEDEKDDVAGAGQPLDDSKQIVAPAPPPRQLRTVDTTTGEVLDAPPPAKDDGHLAAPHTWIPELRRMAMLLAERTGEPPKDIPEKMTRVTARALKTELAEALAEAERAATIQPANADDLDDLGQEPF